MTALGTCIRPHLKPVVPVRGNDFENGARLQRPSATSVRTGRPEGTSLEHVCCENRTRDREYCQLSSFQLQRPLVMCILFYFLLFDVATAGSICTTRQWCGVDFVKAAASPVHTVMAPGEQAGVSKSPLPFTHAPRHNICTWRVPLERP